MTVTNQDRAEWARVALEAFSERCGPPLDNDEDAITAIGDLIADLLHLARHDYGLSRKAIVAIARKGIGMWSAEQGHRYHDPAMNDPVKVEVAGKVYGS